ncbi:hypothetical protein ACQ4XT_14460 [Halobacillus faecis]
MYLARPPRWVAPFFAPIIIADIREQEITIVTILIFALILLILGLSYQLKVDQMIEYHVCIFKVRVFGYRLHPGDIHKIVFKDAGWGTPAASVQKKKGFPIRVVNFDSVKVFADLECFAECKHIKVEERRYFRTVYDRKRSKEKQGA